MRPINSRKLTACGSGRRCVSARSCNLQTHPSQGKARRRQHPSDLASGRPSSSIAAAVDNGNCTSIPPSSPATSSALCVNKTPLNRPRTAQRNATLRYATRATDQFDCPRPASGLHPRYDLVPGRLVPDSASGIRDELTCTAKTTNAPFAPLDASAILVRLGRFCSCFFFSFCFFFILLCPLPGKTIDRIWESRQALEHTPRWHKARHRGNRHCHCLGHTLHTVHHFSFSSGPALQAHLSATAGHGHSQRPPTRALRHSPSRCGPGYLHCRTLLGPAHSLAHLDGDRLYLANGTPADLPFILRTINSNHSDAFGLANSLSRALCRF